MNKNAGFALVELLVVVLIIGILAAVALPQYQKAVLKSRAASSLAKVNALEKAEQEFKMANGYYTGDLSGMSIDTGVWSCNKTEASAKDFCQFFVEGGLGWEVHFGDGASGNAASYRIFCIARNASANQVCKDYGSLEKSDKGNSYYLVREIY